MSESNAVLKPSISHSGPPPLVRVDAKGHGTARDNPPAAQAGRTVQGRQVVIGVTAPHHRVASRTALAVTTPLCALAGLAGLYAWASGIDTSNYEDGQSYQLHWRNGLIGAAGLLAGALPPILAWGRYQHQRYCERKYLRQPDNGSPKRQLAALIDHAVADSPLTLAGLHTCMQRIETLRGVVPARDCALSLARLGLAVPVDADGCLADASAPFAQLDALVSQLARMRAANIISLGEFREALLSLADHLRAPGRPDAPQADAIARRLLGAYAQATARGDDKDAKTSDRPVLDDERLWDRADFIVDLCGTRHFTPHGLVVQLAASDLLHCDPRAYREAKPITPKRPPRDAKGHAAAGIDTDRLLHTPVRHLKDEAGRAIHRALHKDCTAVDQARLLLTILHTIASRRDLPPGAFLEGLLPPEKVSALAQAVATDRSPVPEGVDRAALIAELPRLSQLQGSARMLEGVVEALGRLPQHAHEGQGRTEQDARDLSLCHWIDVACLAANARITGTGQEASLPVGSAMWLQALRSPVCQLHQPWLDEARRAAQVGVALRTDTQHHAPDVVIQMSDFLRDKGADDS